MIRLHLIALDEVQADPRTLCGEEKARAARFRFAQHRDRYIVCRAMLRQLLAEALGMPPEAVPIRYGPQGKPESLLAFNVSHSGSQAVIALGGTLPLGVDIEAVRHDVDPLLLGRTVFTEQEQAALAALPTEEQAAAFFVAWTRKEALIKAEGGGFSSPLLARTVWPHPEPWIAERYQLDSIAAGEGYVAALAVAKKDARQTLPGD